MKLVFYPLVALLFLFATAVQDATSDDMLIYSERLNNMSESN
jgi:hypothetical protein